VVRPLESTEGGGASYGDELLYSYEETADGLLVIVQLSPRTLDRWKLKLPTIIGNSSSWQIGILAHSERR